MNITFTELLPPTSEIAATMNRWGNDPELIPFIRPNFTKEALEAREAITVVSLLKRLKYNQIYLIYINGELVGEISYQIDPEQLYLKELSSAWIGINIGEASARGKGIGTQAMEYLEDQIKARGLSRIELGVFEFNTNAIKLYKKMGYQEIGRIEKFTYWQGKMWTDIRMEKRLK
ncbi:MAG: GNAT family N-acetyltransferase [Anaerolineae bacterium]|jgi:RimJ/RimL family protein N-acetyltransferase|nr:GNAT family N-acetyltransferase [Anaerolineae bacterium]MBT3712653.1 GNAT family N-acetyltransferase [Anaerolineae bacterium]MBT4312546.1 GNAT family N-acetyltransferase [Anaerolineae bacterium]MBT4457669.1 GNAT family N-acetyltransferase [Anaerolineae bacterium]MBT4841164.1 GNAT family N-acetyltransferase [Anaerolineae bacterium]